MRNELESLVDNFLAFYSTNRHHPQLSDITDHLLSLALSARGYNNYESQERSGEAFFIEEIVSKTNPELCVDVGANSGSYSAKIIESTASQVVAFEPLPEAFSQLKSNLGNFSSRIKFENIAVGASPGELTINWNPSATSHASFVSEISEIPYIKNNSQLNCKLTTLDQYFDENHIMSVDLIKIDVEGFESEVFKGASRVFSRIRPRFIQIEFNWHQLFRGVSLYYFAQQLPGYKVYQLLPGGWIERDPRDPLCNIFLYSNFVFVLPNASVLA